MTVRNDEEADWLRWKKVDFICVFLIVHIYSIWNTFGGMSESTDALIDLILLFKRYGSAYVVFA